MTPPRINIIESLADWYSGGYALIPAYGQSRSNNNAEGVDNPASTPRRVLTSLTDPLRPAQCLMLNCDRAPGKPTEYDFAADQAKSFADYCEGRGGFSSRGPIGQSLGPMMLYIAAKAEELGLPGQRMIYLAGGEPGKTIDQIKEDASPFAGENGTYVIFDRYMRMIQNAFWLAQQYGRSLTVPMVPFLHGEANMALNGNNMTEAQYTDKALALHEAIGRRTQLLIGQAVLPDIVYDITSGTPDDTADGSGRRGGVGGGVQLAQVSMALANRTGRLFCIGPAYYLPYFGAEHMTKEGVAMLAEMFGRFYVRRLLGETPSFMYASSITLSGSVITIQCSRPQGGIVLDTTTVPAATGTHSGTGRSFVYGFEFTDDSGVSINRVSVDSGEIIIRLSGTPTTNARLGYAYNGLGPTSYTDLSGRSDGVYTPGSWGNIRDEFSEASMFVPGMYHRNFLAPFNKVF